MLRVTPSAAIKIDIVTISWILLKDGLSTSNERDGEIRAPKKSRPEASSSASDSRRPGNVAIRESPINWGQGMRVRSWFVEQET